jgi:hypothetical protein
MMGTVRSDNIVLQLTDDRDPELLTAFRLSSSLDQRRPLDLSVPEHCVSMKVERRIYNLK